MQLRDASRSQRPRRYREYTGPTNIDRPAFVHEDPSFDEEVVDHCAFPSLDMHHPGPGPSAIWKTRRKLEVAAAKHPVIFIDCEQEESDEEDSEDEDDDHVQENPPSQDDDEHGSQLSSNPPRCSSAEADVPCRLILTVKDMPKLARGDTGTEQPKDSNTDKDGDTIMESSAQGSGETDQPSRRFTVNIIKRPISSISSPLDPTPSGRRPKTVSLGHRAPRITIDNNDPLPQLETVSSPVEDDSWIKDIFQPDTDWSRPSYINYDEKPRVTNIFKTCPNWTDLSDGVKFIILHDMAENGLSFTRACTKLSLRFDDISEMIELVRVQRGKIYQNNISAAQQNDANNIQTWLEKDCPTPREEALVTDILTEDDIRRARTFLKFMGLHDVASNMGYYLGISIGGAGVGTAAKDYNIPLNHFRRDGWEDLAPHFRVGCQDKVEIMWQDWKKLRERHPPVMSIGELLVRMDAPPDTVNPRRLLPDFEAARRRREEEVDTRGVMGLHLDNYLDALPDGTIFNGIDGGVVTLEDRGRMLSQLEGLAWLALRRSGDDEGVGGLGGGEGGDIVQDHVEGQGGGDPMNIEAGVVLPSSHEQRRPVPDVTAATQMEDDEENVTSRTQQDVRPRAPSPDADPLSVLDPSARLDDAVGSVLKKYQHLLTVPAKQSRASLRRRSQSLEFELETELVEASSAPRQNKKKKVVQFEAEDDSEYEDSPRRKKSPEKKDKRHELTPRTGARPRLLQNTVGVGRYTDDAHHAATPSPSSARTATGRRNNRRIVPDDDDDDYMEEEEDEVPSAQSSPVITPRAVTNVAGDGEDDSRPTPKRGDHTAELELLANKIASRSVRELAEEYSLQRDGNGVRDESDTVEESPASGRRRRRRKTRTAGGIGNEAASSRAEAAVPSRQAPAGLGQPIETRTEQGSQSPGEAVPAVSHLTSTMSEVEDQAVVPVLPTPQPEDPAREGMLEPESALISPPASRVVGDEQVPQTAIFPEAVPTDKITPAPDVNVEDHPAEGSLQMGLASLSSNAQLLPMETLTDQDQAFSSARFEAPAAGTNVPSSIPDPSYNSGKPVKAGKADNPATEKAPKGKKANKPENQGSEKGVPVSVPKPRTKRKSGSGTSNSAAAAVATGEAANPASAVAAVPPKRQSTTPIPLPVIPGMPRLMYPPQQRPMIANKKPANASLLSEEQIRRMGGQRAEVEIFKNRERARFAAAAAAAAASSLGGNTSPPFARGSPMMPNMGVQGPRGMNMGMNTTMANTSGASANPNASTSGSVSVSGSTPKRTSSGVKIPENFASEHNTTSYITAQDQSISQAFGIAKERTHGVCLPSGGKRSGTAAAKFAPAIVEQYNQLMAGKKVQTGTLTGSSTSDRSSSSSRRQNVGMPGGGAAAGYSSLEGYPSSYSSAHTGMSSTGTAQKQAQSDARSSSSSMAMAGSNNNNNNTPPTPNARLGGGAGTGQQNSPTSRFNSGTSTPNPSPSPNANARSPSPSGYLPNAYLGGRVGYLPARPGGKNPPNQNPFSSSPMRLPRLMTPAQQAEQIQAQRRAHFQENARGFGMGHGQVQGQGYGEGQGQRQGYLPLHCPGPLTGGIPPPALSLSQSFPHAGINMNMNMNTSTGTSMSPPQQQQQPPPWTTQEVDPGRPYLQGSLNDLGLGFEMGLLQDQNQSLPQSLPQSQTTANRVVQSQPTNRVQAQGGQTQAQAQGQKKKKKPAYANRRTSFGSSPSPESENTGKNIMKEELARIFADDSEDRPPSPFWIGPGGRDEDEDGDRYMGPEEAPSYSHVSASATMSMSTEAQMQSFTDLLGGGGDFDFDFQVPGLDAGTGMGLGDGVELDLRFGAGVGTGTGTGAGTGTGTGGDSSSNNGGGGLGLNPHIGMGMDMDMDVDMPVVVGMEAIDPRILGDMGDLGDLGNTDTGNTGDMEMEES